MARLLEIGRVETLPAPTCDRIRFARSIVENEPDAYVLAEATGAELDWFVTHDQEHFLKERKVSELNFHIGTPGDLIQSLTEISLSSKRSVCYRSLTYLSSIKNEKNWTRINTDLHGY